MTSKTFKSVNDNTCELDVRANDCGVFIAFSRAGQIRQASTFAPSDAPALALAILEAAGFEDSSSGGHITGARIAVGDLKRHVKMHERITAEAKEQAELEAEALELFKVSGAYGSDRLFLKFSHLDDNIQKAWLAVARKAREMRAEK